MLLPILYQSTRDWFLKSGDSLSPQDFPVKCILLFPVVIGGLEHRRCAASVIEAS